MVSQKVFPSTGSIDALVQFYSYNQLPSNNLWFFANDHQQILYRYPNCYCNIEFKVTILKFLSSNNLLNKVFTPLKCKLTYFFNI